MYKDVVKEIPTLAKTTVYSTLTLFLELKIVRGLYVEENEIRYDAILSNTDGDGLKLIEVCFFQ